LHPHQAPRYSGIYVAVSLHSKEHDLKQGIRQASFRKERDMLATILIVVVILILIGALPTWPHSRNWGYFPSGGLGLILLILIILQV